MNLNDRIIQSFEMTVNVSIDLILKNLEENKKKAQWVDVFFADTIDYKELITEGNRLEIVRKPIFFFANRPNGKIIIDLFKISENTTHIKCDIIPFNNTLPLRLGCHFAVFSFFSILFLLFDRGKNPFSLIGIPLFLFSLVFYLYYLYTKNSLIYYSKNVIKAITNQGKVIR